ncbi:unnamed protein product [Choristocarpus tenellus]
MLVLLIQLQEMWRCAVRFGRDSVLGKAQSLFNLASTTYYRYSGGSLVAPAIAVTSVAAGLALGEGQRNQTAECRETLRNGRDIGSDVEEEHAIEGDGLVRIRKTALDFLKAQEQLQLGSESRVSTPETDKKPRRQTLYNVDDELKKFPDIMKGNAFHETLNGEHTIFCPYFLIKREGDGGLQSVVRFGPAVQGYPRLVHGGVTALTFDQLFGWALFFRDITNAFTAYLKVDYKMPIPCETIGVVDVSVYCTEGRKIFLRGSLQSLDGTITYAMADALFVMPKPVEQVKVAVVPTAEVEGGTSPGVED